MPTGNERREYLRADLNVFINEESRTARLLAKAVDISERGLHYIMPANAPRRDAPEVTLEFSLPGEEQPVRALGRVIYDREAEHSLKTAIEFTMIGTKDADRIRNYVGRRKRAELFAKLRDQHLLH